MKKVCINKDKINVLSDVVSEYIHNLGDKHWIEGAFILPCGADNVESLILGIMYNNWRLGQRIQQSSKTRLHMVSSGVGINVHVKEINMNKYLGYSDVCANSLQAKEMLKGGHIIYDANGYLGNIQEEYKKDAAIDNLENRGVVKMEPAIQYKKVGNLY